jgi:NAD(P)-dependent dehydrogenase (short-subunit alcohol dehydrogenase family)
MRTLVTGAGSGIGAAVAQALAGAGARVIVSDIDMAAAQAVADEIGEAALPCCLDVTSPADWAAAMDLAQRTGGLSVLVANAGVPVGGSVDDLSIDAWRRAFAVHADGAFLGIKAALPLLRAAGGASIITIASVAAVAARGDMAAYGASKAALLSLTKSVALHCAHQGWDIRANAVLPAYVDTPMLDAIAPHHPRKGLIAALAKQVPQGRIGTAQDVAQAVLYLASPASAFMNGAEIRLDGGMSAQ